MRRSGDKGAAPLVSDGHHLEMLERLAQEPRDVHLRDPEPLADFAPGGTAVRLAASPATAVAEAAAKQEEQHDHDEEDGEHEPRAGLSGWLPLRTPTGRPADMRAPRGDRPTTAP